MDAETASRPPSACSCGGVVVVGSLYRAEYGAWLTPVEIFQPYYARAILNWILETRQRTAAASASASSSSPSAEPVLRIIEVGGGSGRCACDILDALRTFHPHLYARTHYTIIEASAQFSEWQQHTLAPHLQAQSGGSADGPVIRLLTQNVAHFKEYIPVCVLQMVMGCCCAEN
jgi:hypothetical protein